MRGVRGGWGRTVLISCLLFTLTLTRRSSLAQSELSSSRETFESAFGLSPVDGPEASGTSELEDLAVAEGPADRVEHVNKLDDVEVKSPPSEPAEIADFGMARGLSPRILGDADETLGKYVRYDSDDPEADRYAPQSEQSTSNYVITETRLRDIRAKFMYWFFDKGGDNHMGDYQTDIHNSIPQIHKNFNFQLPFFGFRYNYTRLSMNGFLEFSDPPEHYTYPLVFPVKDWPKSNDPAFIGIFFSKCRIGQLKPTDIDQRKPGVYFRMERDLQKRTDQFGVEMRERLTWDIREGVVGSDSFFPKHAVIVTWKNMSFAGGIDISLTKTNTFQMVLATDEVYTYAIFNYLDIQWTSHTEAGGDTTGGEGGVPAYIGFNGGNGTQSYEYMPYSQASTLRDLSGRGWANGFPGRHIFRIDEKIMLGTCNKDIAGANLPLVFAPESGNMLGGTVVNITGPCFLPNDKVRCRFDTEEVVGTVIDTNRAICVQPFVKAEGYIRFAVAVNSGRFDWKGQFFIETPSTATEKIYFSTKAVHERDPAEIKITWNSYNLTSNLNAVVQLSLWGYRETTIKPELQYINIIEEGTANSGSYVITPANYKNRYDPRSIDMQFGFLQINLTNAAQYSGLQISPVLWSKPIPLGWYFGPQWERLYGNKWPQQLCNQWIMHDRYLKNFAAEVSLCPCTLEHALNDKGRYHPDYDCDKDSNPECYYNQGAIHCVTTGAPNPDGSQQQCCYDKNRMLMLTYDQQWGSKPRRSHNLGFLPWNEANKVPTLSHWFHDMVPMYSCCMWQEEQAVGCETFRFERRPSQDCIAYQSPAVGAVFGDPHVATFDGLEYTFNGKGEFVLVRVDDAKDRLDVQARFEQLPDNFYGEVRATQLTAVAAKGNNSATIEVRLRPTHAQWRYRLDVFADNKRVYFDRTSLKFQHFSGVVVYTPTNILNQSEVIVMFDTGAGIEVVENQGFVTARVYLPWSYMNKTRGLLGNYSFDVIDDFTNPDGMLSSISNLNNFEAVHKDFALNWLLEDREDPRKGAALFTREFGRTASYYANRTFEPEWRKLPEDFLPTNRTPDINRAHELCGDSYQCQYDYAMSLNRDLAHFTRNYYDSWTQIRAINNKRITSCGILETPRFGRKNNFLFVPGTKVIFECNQDFVLIGDQRRICLPEGRWDVSEYGYTECLRHQEYSSRQAGMASGIILACLVPILLIVICIAYRTLQARKEEREREEALADRSRRLEMQRMRKLEEERSSSYEAKSPGCERLNESAEKWLQQGGDASSGKSAKNAIIAEPEASDLPGKGLASASRLENLATTAKKEIPATAAGSSSCAFRRAPRIPTDPDARARAVAESFRHDKKLGNVLPAALPSTKSKQPASYLDLYQRRFSVERLQRSPEGSALSVCGDSSDERRRGLAEAEEEVARNCSFTSPAADLSRDDESELSFYRRLLRPRPNLERLSTFPVRELREASLRSVSESLIRRGSSAASAPNRRRTSSAAKKLKQKACSAAEVSEDVSKVRGRIFLEPRHSELAALRTGASEIMRSISAESSEAARRSEEKQVVKARSGGGAERGKERPVKRSSCNQSGPGGTRLASKTSFITPTATAGWTATALPGKSKSVPTPPPTAKPGKLGQAARRFNEMR